MHYCGEPTKTRHIDSSRMDREIREVGKQEDSGYRVIIDLWIASKDQETELFFEVDQ